MSQDVRAPDRGQAGAIYGDKLNHAQEACGFGRVLVHRVDRRGRHRLPIRRHRALSLGTAEQTDPAGRADNDGISGRRADPEIAFPAAVEMNFPGFEYPVPKSSSDNPTPGLRMVFIVSIATERSFRITPSVISSMGISGGRP